MILLDFVAQILSTIMETIKLYYLFSLMLNLGHEGELSTKMIMIIQPLFF